MGNVVFMSLLAVAFAAVAAWQKEASFWQQKNSSTTADLRENSNSGVGGHTPA
jgi:hypothetical protein